MAETFDEAAAGGDRPVLRMQLIDAKQRQRTQHRDKGSAVDQEHPAGADRGDQRAGNRRADHPGGVERGGIQRHRIGQIGVADQFGDEGLARRRVERGDATEQEGEHIDMPELNKAGDGEQALDFLRKTHGFADARRPSLVVLDLNLPRRGSLEVLAEMKAVRTRSWKL